MGACTCDVAPSAPIESTSQVFLRCGFIFGYLSYKKLSISMSYCVGITRGPNVLVESTHYRLAGQLSV